MIAPKMALFKLVGVALAASKSKNRNLQTKDMIAKLKMESELTEEVKSA